MGFNVRYRNIMKKILSLILITISLVGCSKSSVNTSWKISANPLGNDEYELKAELQKLTKTQFGLWVKVNVEVINAPPLILKPGIPAEGIIPNEPDVSQTMHSKAMLNASGEAITFELLVEDDGESYSTNGVITIE